MSFKEKIGNYLLNKKFINKPKRKISFGGTDNMMQIGILFEASVYDDFLSIKAFEKELKKMGKSVSLIGYSHSKILHEQYISDQQRSFICRKDFNWYNGCSSNLVDDFVKKPFDTLICISKNNHFPIRYIETLSMAKFKVGRSSSQSSDLDLMLEIPTGMDITLQINEFWKYLEMISPAKEKKVEEFNLIV